MLTFGGDVKNTFRMTNRVLCLTASACALAGFSLLYQGSALGLAGPLGRGLAIALIVVPVGLATNIASRRRRHANREDDHSSLEYQAHRDTSSRALGDALVLASLLVLVLAVWPTTAPVVWGVLFLGLVVADYWVRYLASVRTLRG